MQPLKAKVVNGHWVIEEKAEAPEGTVVELFPVTEQGDIVFDTDDGLSDEERAELHAELRASMAEARKGNLIDADEVLAELGRTQA